MLVRRSWKKELSDWDWWWWWKNRLRMTAVRGANLDGIHKIQDQNIDSCWLNCYFICWFHFLFENYSIEDMNWVCVCVCDIYRFWKCACGTNEQKQHARWFKLNCMHCITLCEIKWNKMKCIDTNAVFKLEHKWNAWPNNEFLLERAS